jgi:hypothetical protein
MPNGVCARRWLYPAGLAVLACAVAFACSTVEPVSFADGGDCVAGGCENNGATTTSSSGGNCAVDPMCAVSFKTDIFANIFDGPAGCTEATACHGNPNSTTGVVMLPGNAGASLASLKAAKIPTKPPSPYIVGCDQAHSGILCSMALDADAGANPFGTCGDLMPITLGGGMKLTSEQLQKIADWITCGAPDN